MARRVTPPILSEAMAKPLMQTGDDVLDALLLKAREDFLDSNPVVRRGALEKLWDAWERLKTLNDPTDKKRSVSKLLGSVGAGEELRQVLEDEALTLTEIGNSFQIRHFETNRPALNTNAEVEYLFHRMWAIVWFLLSSRT